jgi:hypothetical protein
MALTPGELRRRMLHLGTVAGTDAAFAAYREEWLPMTMGPRSKAALTGLVEQGFDAGWTRALQAVDRLIEQIAKED